jgi:Kelch motif
MRFKTFAAALLSGGALLAAAAFAQGIGRWTVGTPMPSASTEVAVAEVGGKIYVVGGFGGECELEIYDSAADRWSRGASIPRALHLRRGRPHRRQLFAQFGVERGV